MNSSFSPILDAIAPVAPTLEERTRALEEWDRRIQARADRYPPGHRVTIDRAEFYAGREDGTP